MQTGAPLPAVPWSTSGTWTAVGVTCRMTLQSTVGGQMDLNVVTEQEAQGQGSSLAGPHSPLCVGSWELGLVLV